MEVEEGVIAMIRDRRDKGRKKYGVSMEREDLTEVDWLRHAQEEALDLAIYLERLIRDKTEELDKPNDTLEERRKLLFGVDYNQYLQVGDEVRMYHTNQVKQSASRRIIALDNANLVMHVRTPEGEKESYHIGSFHRVGHESEFYCTSHEIILFKDAVNVAYLKSIGTAAR